MIRVELTLLCAHPGCIASIPSQGSLRGDGRITRIQIGDGLQAGWSLSVDNVVEGGTLEADVRCPEHGPADFMNILPRSKVSPTEPFPPNTANGRRVGIDRNG